MAENSKEKPILMTGEMVRATLDDRKRQTRRLDGLDEINESPNDWEFCELSRHGYKFHNLVYGDVLYVKRYEVGMKLYAAYRATDPDWETMEGWKWRPAIHMPRWASRITLEITNVRVERVQDISEEDAIAEGVSLAVYSGVTGNRYYDCGVLDKAGKPECLFHRRAKDAFSHLWTSIYGKDSWEKSPFVWVLTFKPV